MAIHTPSDLDHQTLVRQWPTVAADSLSDEPVLLGDVVAQVLQALIEQQPQAKIPESWAV
jgi:hypothetical protein